jgi:hypothetical protein
LGGSRVNDEELKIAKVKERFRNDEEFRNKVIEYWVVLIEQEKKRLENE